jgi:hypothetical protein
MEFDILQPVTSALARARHVMACALPMKFHRHCTAEMPSRNISHFFGVSVASVCRSTKMSRPFATPKVCLARPCSAHLPLPPATGDRSPKSPRHRAYAISHDSQNGSQAHPGPCSAPRTNVRILGQSRVCTFRSPFVSLDHRSSSPRCTRRFFVPCLAAESARQPNKTLLFRPHVSRASCVPPHAQRYLMRNVPH